MNRTNVSLRAIFVATVASSLFALSLGCSSGSTSGNGAIAPAPISLPENPRSVETPAQMSSTTSANNTRDLANAQPESVLDSKPSRDVDLNGGEAQSGQPLNYQTLGDTLTKIGLTPEDDKDCWVMKVKTTTDDQISWTFPIAVSLSPDQSVVWITCPITQIDKNGAPNSQTLADLLSANYHLGVSFFVIDPKHILILQQTTANAGVTPQLLGSNLKSFFGSLKQSEPLYKSLIPISGGGQGGGGGGGGGNPFQ